MEDIEKFLPFVKSQAEFQDRMAQRFRSDEKRSALHSGTANRFREIIEYLEKTVEKPTVDPVSGSGLSLSWGELQDLPEELVQELSITDSDKLDFSIVELVDRHGGVATLDRILVEIYRLTGEILKRPNLNSRLYRMGQKGLIHSVSGRKGVYSTRELSEEEISKLN